MRTHIIGAIALYFGLGALVAAEPAELKQEVNTWVKRSPLKDGPVSPGMGYETSLGYDPVACKLIRWGGHNQGGGGEQNAETWVYDPLTAKWEFKQPNTSPPGVCCAQQNVFDVDQNRFLRFAAASGNHGWQWYREIYLSGSTVWNYDLASNTWRDRRPAPTPDVHILRCASWDSDHGVAVIFGGEGSNEGTVVYDPYTNTWTRMKPAKQPASRSGGNMAYDAANKVHVMFGSQFADDAHTWTYDLRKNEWRDCKPDRMPPTDRNDPVLAYDAVNRVVIALVRVVDERQGDEIHKAHLETWAYDAAKNTWTQMKPAREPDGWGNRRRVMTAIPNLNVILTEHYVNPTEKVPDVEREQQIWTYRYAEAKEGQLAPPHQVTAVTEQSTVVLSWQAPSTRGVTEYVVEQTAGAQFWRADWKVLATLSARRQTYRHTDLKPGTIYSYRLRATYSNGKQSEPSRPVRAQPRIVEDAVVSVVSKTEVSLTWTALKVEDVSGYHVERAPVDVLSDDEILRLKTDTPPLDESVVGGIRAIGPFTRLTDNPLTKASFTDTTIDLSKPTSVEKELTYERRWRADRLDSKGKPYRLGVYAYRIRAVNTLGVESGPSAWYLTIPTAPQHVFARENGDKCDLKWAKNAEQSIKGYRVYRMESPKINGPGQKVTRLTEAAIEKTTFTDDKATKETKRYWIVAVDALGQEGIPSAPVWHYRQYQKYYTPFVGEWHQ